MFSVHAVKILLDVVTEVVVLLGQSYTSHEVELAVLQSGSEAGVFVPSLKENNKQRKVIQNISKAGNIIQRVFACKEFGLNKVLKMIFLLLEVKEG